MTNEITDMSSALPLSATPKIKYSTLALLRAIVPKQKDNGLGQETLSFKGDRALDEVIALKDTTGAALSTQRMIDLSDEVFSQFEGVKVYHLFLPTTDNKYSTYYSTNRVSYITVNDQPLFKLQHNVEHGAAKTTAYRAVFTNCADMSTKDVLDAMNDDLTQWKAWVRDEKAKNERLLRDQRCDMIRLADTLLHAASVGS